MLVGPVIGGVPAGTPFTFYKRKNEDVDMPKPFMTYDQQIEKLKSKGLTLTDETAAKETLHQIGYYALITGYKDLFKNPTTRNYRDGTTLEDILALYRFDEHLRELTLHYLFQVERHIRSLLSYAFCVEFGDRQTAYLDPQNYQGSSPKRRAGIQILISKHLDSLLARPTNYDYLEHYKRVHGNVPLWVLVNALTFGTLSKFYEYAAPQVQTAVSCEFEGVDEGSLTDLLKFLTDYRNRCAHGNRLFSHRCTTKDIPDLPLHRKMRLPKRGETYMQGKRDYFAVVIALRYLLPADAFAAYKRELNRLIQKAVRENRQISEQALLMLMGFPPHWKKITQYKKV